MAGFDKVDPAMACLLLSSIVAMLRVFAGRLTGDGRQVINLIKKCRRAQSWRELPWQEIMTFAGEPERRPCRACWHHDR